MDDILSLQGLQHYEDSDSDPEPTSIESMEVDTMQLEALTCRIHEQHQPYLLQQDILGTFYDTLSIFSSLPLFKKLETIRIVDFEIPPDVTPAPEETPYTPGQEAAVVRAIHNMSKTLAFLDYSALPKLRCWEIERFDYSVLKPPGFGSNSRERETLTQFEEAFSRISILRIKKLNYIGLAWQHFSSIFADLLMGSACNDLEELAIADGHNREQECCIWASEALLPSFTRYHRRYVVFPCLRKLELSGHSLMGLLNLASLFFFLTPGILKELVLDSLTMAYGEWEDLFRIIAPKTKWAEENQVWPGAHAHAIVQTSFSSPHTLEIDVEILAFQVDQDRGRAQQRPKPTQLLWKGLQLEKCRLKGLQYIDYAKRPIKRQFLQASVEEVLERWMLDGLDDEEYEILFPHVFSH